MLSQYNGAAYAPQLPAMTDKNYWTVASPTNIESITQQPQQESRNTLILALLRRSESNLHQFLDSVPTRNSSMYTSSPSSTSTSDDVFFSDYTSQQRQNWFEKVGYQVIESRPNPKPLQRSFGNTANDTFVAPQIFDESYQLKAYADATVQVGGKKSSSYDYATAMGFAASKATTTTPLFQGLWSDVISLLASGESVRTLLQRKFLNTLCQEFIDDSTSSSVAVPPNIVYAIARKWFELKYTFSSSMWGPVYVCLRCGRPDAAVVGIGSQMEQLRQAFTTDYGRSRYAATCFTQTDRGDPFRTIVLLIAAGGAVRFGEAIQALNDAMSNVSLSPSDGVWARVCLEGTPALTSLQTFVDTVCKTDGLDPETRARLYLYGGMYPQCVKEVRAASGYAEALHLSLSLLRGNLWKVPTRGLPIEYEKDCQQWVQHVLAKHTTPEIITAYGDVAFPYLKNISGFLFSACTGNVSVRNAFIGHWNDGNFIPGGYRNVEVLRDLSRVCDGAGATQFGMFVFLQCGNVHAAIDVILPHVEEYPDDARSLLTHAYRMNNTDAVFSLLQIAYTMWTLREEINQNRVRDWKELVKVWVEVVEGCGGIPEEQWDAVTRQRVRHTARAILEAIPSNVNGLPRKSMQKLEAMAN